MLEGDSTNPWRAYLNRDSAQQQNIQQQNIQARKHSLALFLFHREAAAPLKALRDRDIVELIDWFARDDMADLEADINQKLILLFPEPYWDEDFAFLLKIA